MLRRTPFVAEIFYRALVVSCFGFFAMADGHASAGSQTIVDGGTTTTQFDMPAGYCFMQTDLNNDVTKATLKHHLLVSPDHVAKTGDIFVAFYDERNGEVWLYGTADKLTWTWQRYEAGKPPPAYFSGSLDIVTPIYIVKKPTDLSHFKEAGVFYVGYGLRLATKDSLADSFANMVENHPKQYRSLWIVGQHESNTIRRICVNINKISVTEYASIQ